MEVRTRFVSGIVWNLGSFAVMAASGFALNVLIGRFYGAATFGIFTQVLACYYVFSQLAVGGLGYSTLSFVGRSTHSPDGIRGYVFSALVLVLALSALVTVVAAALSKPIGVLLDSPDVTAGILWTLPGLACFALNKVLLFALNGIGQMRAHALFTTLRYLLIIIIAAGLVFWRADSLSLPLALSAGEIILLPILATYTHRLDLWAVQSVLKRHVDEHVAFAARSFLTPLIQDASTKIDVFLLGIFAPDDVVGVYAFAAMLALEGFYQLLYVVQINLSPLMSAIPAEARCKEIRRLVHLAWLRLTPPFAVLALIAALSFVPITRVLTGNSIFDSGWVYFAILAGAIALCSAYLPFLTALNQWNRPGTLLTLVFVQALVNVLLNLVLIPFFGGVGAALATGVSFVVLALIVRRALFRTSSESSRATLHM